jgi:hypothetical protein
MILMAKLIESIGGPTILIFVGGIIAAVGAVWASYDQNKTNTKLAQKNEEIARLNRETANAVTGGDSVCYLLPLANLPGMVTVVQKGRFPLYDVSVRIVDLDDPASNVASLSAQTRNSFTLGNIPPESAQVLQSVITLVGDRKRFNIFFSARNGFFTQELRMRLVNGEWKSAIRVVCNLPDGKATSLFTQIMDDYPKEKDGSIDWK